MSDERMQDGVSRVDDIRAVHAQRVARVGSAKRRALPTLPPRIRAAASIPAERPDWPLSPDGMSTLAPRSDVARCGRVNPGAQWSSATLGYGRIGRTAQAGQMVGSSVTGGLAPWAGLGEVAA